MYLKLAIVFVICSYIYSLQVFYGYISVLFLLVLLSTNGQMYIHKLQSLDFIKNRSGVLWSTHQLFTNSLVGLSFLCTIENSWMRSNMQVYIISSWCWWENPSRGLKAAYVLTRTYQQVSTGGNSRVINAIHQLTWNNANYWLPSVGLCIGSY